MKKLAMTLLALVLTLSLAGCFGGTPAETPTEPTEAPTQPQSCVHEAVSDDGDCTTAVACKHCSEIAIAAKDSHDFTGKPTLSGDGHIYTCPNEGCTAQSEVKPHEGGVATCQEPAVCDLCENAYGEKNPENHASSAFEITDNNDGTHRKSYVCCGVVAEAAQAHHGGAATCITLAICEDCNASYGELLSHTPAEDDGDCETPLTCATCPMVLQEGHIDRNGDYICDREGCDAIVFVPISTAAELISAAESGGYYKLTGDIRVEEAFSFVGNQILVHIDLGGYTIYTAGGMHISLDSVVYLTNGAISESMDLRSPIYSYGTLTIANCTLSCTNYIGLYICDGHVTLEDTVIHGGLAVTTSYLSGTVLVAKDNVTLFPDPVFGLNVDVDARAIFSFDPTAYLDEYSAAVVINNGDGTWIVTGANFDPTNAQTPLEPEKPVKRPYISEIALDYNEDNFNGETNTLTLNPGETIDVILSGKNLALEGVEHRIILGSESNGLYFIHANLDNSTVDENGNIRYSITYEWIAENYEYLYDLYLIGYSNDLTSLDAYIHIGVTLEPETEN